jgi:hypothetical protein
VSEHVTELAQGVPWALGTGRQGTRRSDSVAAVFQHHMGDPVGVKRDVCSRLQDGGGSRGRTTQGHELAPIRREQPGHTVATMGTPGLAGQQRVDGRLVARLQSIGPAPSSHAGIGQGARSASEQRQGRK